MSERMNKERAIEIFKSLGKCLSDNEAILRLDEKDIKELTQALDIAIDSLERNCCKYCSALCDSREDIKDDFVKEPTIKEIDGKLYMRLEGWTKY